MLLIAIPLALIFLFIFAGFAGRVCRMLQFPFESLAQEFAFSAALGMGLVSYAVLILGLCGQYQALPIVLLLLALGLIGASPAWDLARRMCSRFQSQWRSLGPGGIFSAAALLVGMIGALGPEIGNDALCYHLNVPKIFLQQGFISVLKYDPNSHYPFLLQNLYGVGLALQGPALAKMLHWMTGLIAACATFGAVRRHGSRDGAFAAAAIFLLTPGILNQLGIAYVDVGLACFSFLALYALTLYWEERRWQQLVLAGCFMGFALSIKHLAMMSMAVFLVLVSGMFVWRFFARQGRAQNDKVGDVLDSLCCLEKFWHNTGIFLSCTLLFSFFWYTRSYYIFGNPVHPFYGEWFGVDFMPMSYHNYQAQGFGKGWLAFLMLPWNVTMRPLAFEDFVSQIGPVFLAFGPAMLFIKPWPRRWKIFGSYVLLFTLLWFFMGQNMRFWYAALPPLAVLTAAGVFALPEPQGLRARILPWMLYGFLTLELALGLYHYRPSLKTFWSSTRQAAYLVCSERTYTVGQWINANLPAGSKILVSDETHGFYIKPRMIRDNFYHRWTHYDEKCAAAADGIAFLKKEGFTHVLHAITVHSAKMQEAQGPLRLESLLKDAPVRDKYFHLLHRESFAGEGGEKVEYLVYSLR